MPFFTENGTIYHIFEIVISGMEFTGGSLHPAYGSDGEG